ncbi:MAG: ribosomal protein S18-alanine N-acetyltransferase [Oscillospiraceae bacterium]
MIRAASLKDISDILALDTATSEEPMTKSQLEEELFHKHARLVCATHEGAFLGFCDMHIVADDAHINSFAVCENMRRRTVGSQLLEFALSLAKEAGCRIVSLEVRCKNTAAIALYEKFGFSRAGMRRGFYKKPRDDAQNMLLYLDGAAKADEE